MDYRLISRIVGLLLCILSGAMLACLVYAHFYEPAESSIAALRSLGSSTGITLGAGVIMQIAGRRAQLQLLRKEAIALVGCAWIACAAFGALPYMLCEPHLNPAAAFFESMSGFTTTGATAIPDLNVVPRSVLLWRCLTQWLGGMGILVLFVALLSYLGAGSKALFHHESSARGEQGLKARVGDVAVRLWQIYVGLSIVCFGGLLALDMSVFDAVSHTFTTVSTGGFSPYNESIAAFDSIGVELWLTVFMILSSVSFVLYAWMLHGNFERWREEEETRLFLVVIVAGALLATLGLTLAGEHSLSQSIRESLFHVVSIMTTTGFATEDFSQWPPFCELLLLFLMCVGGCAGSTAGGIKIGRCLLFLKIVRHEALAVFRPNLITRLTINGIPTDEGLRRQTTLLVALAGVCVALGTGLVGLLEPMLSIDSCLSAVLANLFNIGPGIHDVGPVENYGFLRSPTLVLLSGLMLVGRLEFLAVVVLFMPSLWRSY